MLPPHVGHHYSNVAFALLGLVVARRAGTSYRAVVEERILRPLGLERTTWEPAGRSRHGYGVDPYADVVRREPGSTCAAPRRPGSCGARPAISAAGRRSSPTATRTCSAPETVEAMWFPQAMFDPETWTLGWGSG